MTVTAARNSGMIGGCPELLLIDRNELPKRDQTTLAAAASTLHSPLTQDSYISNKVERVERRRVKLPLPWFYNKKKRKVTKLGLDQI